MAKVPVQFTLNGSEKAEFIDSGTTLLQALRDKIGDTSPKGGCHQGTCLARSVILDGELRPSCLTLV
ncbi:(2Fe-2S)-binding protein, partial [Mesorhizobium sp. M7A.F.Ca.US.014.04.1.1]